MSAGSADYFSTTGVWSFGSGGNIYSPPSASETSTREFDNRPSRADKLRNISCMSKEEELQRARDNEKKQKREEKRRNQKERKQQEQHYLFTPSLQHYYSSQPSPSPMESSSLRNQYSMPRRSRIYDVPGRENMIEPFTKTRLNIRPEGARTRRLNIKPNC